MGVQKCAELNFYSQELECWHPIFRVYNFAKVLTHPVGETCKGMVLDSTKLEDIWKPNIYLYFPKKYKPVKNFNRISETLTLDPSSGLVKWWGLSFIETSCAMDFSSYPMDSFQCPFLVGDVAG